MTSLALLTGEPPQGSSRWIVCIWWSLLSVSFSKPMGAYTTNLVFPVGSQLSRSVQHSLKRKIWPFVWEPLKLPFLSHFIVNVTLSCFWCECQTSLCLCPQVSVQLQKTSPTRSRTCDQSAAQTLVGRTQWPVQMGKRPATVGQCHIPSRLAKLDVQCVCGQNSISQSYQSLSSQQLPQL